MLSKSTRRVSYLRSPQQPAFEDVVVAAALDHFVAGIVADVVVLVLLEQVVSTHLIAVHEEVLWQKRHN